MKRLLICCALALPLVALTAGPARAEVKSREKSQVKFEGMLGRMMGLFGGKAARDGVVSTTAVKGNRKATMNETTGQVIDLSEEKIYDIDLKNKTYKVTTFDELRRKMREAQEKAQKEAQKEAEKDQGKADKPEPSGKDVEVDFVVKETGQKKSIAGYDAREVVSTITVREKGKTLEDSGGLVMTVDSWMGPQIPAMKELGEFNQRYWKQLQGPEYAAVSAEQMATVIAMYPMVKSATDRLQAEGTTLQGTPLATTTTFESVKSKAAMEQQSTSSGGSGGGLGGMLAKKMMKKEDKPRATIFTVDHEIQEVSTAVGATDVDLPAGFKEKK